MFGFGRKSETRAEPAAPEQRSLAEPTEFDFQIFGATPSLAGVAVTPATAIRVPAVAAGVKALSEAVSILPLHAYRRTETARERDNSLPAFRLLNGASSPWMMGAQLRELLTADAILYGNGYALIVRDSQKEPVELHRVHPSSVTVEIDTRTAEPRYRITEGAGQRFIAFTDILHIRAPSSISTDSVTGKSPLIEAKNAIGLLITLQEHACKLFANGGRPSGILSFPQKLGAEVAKRIKASWQAATGGANAGSTAVLEEGGNFTPLAFNSVDSQFMEIWALAITEVARVLRVPPVLLMDYSRQTWANAETGGQQFLTYSLAPWLARWEAEVSLKLIAPEDREDVFVEHLPDALLRSDFATRATAYGQYRSMGVMTANEVRAGLNLPPLANGNELSNPYTSTTKPEATPPEETKPDA
ncbi:HK97 family phage portal protein [Rhizobium sp. PP-CC-2G-626]|nr:HK97 family phage portal protein [Rhizobium sp. PP-CC-2G-626]